MIDSLVSLYVHIDQLVATLLLWASCAERLRNKFKDLTIKEKEAVKTATAHELMSIKLAAPSSGPGTQWWAGWAAPTRSTVRFREGNRGREERDIEGGCFLCEVCVCL